MNTVSYFAFGLNHKSAPVSIRESFEMNEDKVRQLYRMTQLPAGTESIVLSTCNRTEVWLYGAASSVIDMQSNIETLCEPWPGEHAFTYENEEAIRHVFEVTSGLRSQVLGDAQILSQVKDAYRLAATCEKVGPRLHRLMHTAFATAKRVISTTALGTGGTSIARTAVGTLSDRIGKDNGSSDQISVLVLGGGDMGGRVLKELGNHPLATCFICNRTAERAEKLASRYGATTVPWEQRTEVAAEVDVVFATTGAEFPVITRPDFEQVTLDGPTLFIDISVPRNIDPDVVEIPGISIVNIDQLPIANGNGKNPVRRDLGQALKICDEALREVLGWESETRAVELAVRMLDQTFEAIRYREVERNIHRFSPKDHGNVDRLTRSIIQKLIAIPIVRLKAMVNSDEDLSERLELLGHLFDRGDCEE